MRQATLPNETPTEFWIDRDLAGCSVIIHAGGEVDLISGPELRAELEAAEAQVVPPAPVVLDLTAVTFFGSPGWRVLADHHGRCLAMGSSLQVRTGAAIVRRTLSAVGMDWILSHA